MFKLRLIYGLLFGAILLTMFYFDQTLAAGWRSPLVVGASVGSAAVLAAVIQTPGVSHFFGCRPLGPVGWSIGLSAAAAAGLGAPVASRIADRVAAAGPQRGGISERG